jgi:hypothetical protein
MAARREPQQTTLFDLELDATPGEAELARADERAAPRAREATPSRQLPAPFGRRVLAGSLDVGVQVVVAAAALAGARRMDVALTTAAAPGFVLLVLVFSLFYLVVPLAFWARTPGMAAVRLTARAGDEHPPTFAEAQRRWLAGLVTVLLAGLPALLALGPARRSLADRWSGTELVVGS